MQYLLPLQLHNLMMHYYLQGNNVRAMQGESYMEHSFEQDTTINLCF